MYHGYVRNVTDFGYFVGFLGSLVGLHGQRVRVPAACRRARGLTRPQLKSEAQMSQPFVGQSVRAAVLKVDLQRKRVRAAASGPRRLAPAR